MIYYFCFENARPTGGNKVIYNHVSILNELGFSSAVIHPSPLFRYIDCPIVPVIGISEVRLFKNDLLVLPEDFGPALNTVARGTKKIIFNQNAYNSFRGYSIDSGLAPPYLDREYLATLVVSEDNRQYLKTLFHGLEPFRLHISFNQSLFAFRAAEAKKKQFCFMTRKNGQDAVQIILALKNRSLLSEWSFKAIEGMSEHEVAHTMGESAIFLTFGHPEGISLSNLEALSSGCMVVGYSGMGCREYFNAGYCKEIPFGDISAFVLAAEQAALCFEQQPDMYADQTILSSEYVRTNFSPSREQEDLIQFYSSIGFHPAN